MHTRIAWIGNYRFVVCWEANECSVYDQDGTQLGQYTKQPEDTDEYLFLARCVEEFYGQIEGCHD